MPEQQTFLALPDGTFRAESGFRLTWHGYGQGRRAFVCTCSDFAIYGDCAHAQGLDALYRFVIKFYPSDGARTFREFFGWYQREHKRLLASNFAKHAVA